MIRAPQPESRAVAYPLVGPRINIGIILVAATRHDDFLADRIVTHGMVRPRPWRASENIGDLDPIGPVILPSVVEKLLRAPNFAVSAAKEDRHATISVVGHGVAVSLTRCAH